MEGQGYLLCSFRCFSCLSMVSVGLFWLFLFVAVWSCQQFVAPSSPTSVNLSEHTPCSCFPVWVSCGAAHRYLSCANPGAVNTHHSPKPFIWLFFLVFLCSSSHFLSIYASCKCITALCNKVYLPNSRDFPLSLYCLMASDRAFWREETWILSCFVMLEYHNCQRYCNNL